MNAIRVVSGIALLCGLSAVPGVQAQVQSCDRNHYILGTDPKVGYRYWIATGQLTVARAGHTATLLPDG